MTYEDIQARVAAYLDRDDLDIKIRGWINDTRKDLALTLEKYDCDYLYTEATSAVTEGQAKYGLPSDYLGHLTIWVGQKKLSKLRPREADELTPTDSTSTSATLYLETESAIAQTYEVGAPDYYIERGMEIQLYPTPDSDYTMTLKYFAMPSSWGESASAASSYATCADYITKFHFEAVIFGAAWRGALFLDDEQKKANYWEQYQRCISEMIQREKNKKARDLKVRIKTWRDYDLDTFKRLMKTTN
jgi:hypothetical protein